MYRTLSILRKTWMIAAVGMLAACSENDFDFLTGESVGDQINVSGIDMDEMVVSSLSTRAGAKQDAEKVDWLLEPLRSGLDITYGLYNVTDKKESVAILKLTDDTTNPATYTFTYRSGEKEGKSAIWYNNGAHYFQGVHVPDRIRYTSSETEVDGKAPGLVTDQHDAAASGTLGNYTLLSHYLGMPANYRLTATIERIKLPFRHRLARVVAFVLIDPELNTKLKGYKKNESGVSVDTENATTTSIRFCNVDVLQGVKDQEESSGHHTLTPAWTTARKAIPHFEGERGSYSYQTLTQLDDDFKLYYKDNGGKLLESYPTSSDWKGIHDASDHNGYTEVNYGKVPVYDLIVRPTYTSTDNVMYDEKDYSTKKAELAGKKNKIDFELELENGLRYTKEFKFDLDANYQTVVYLRISREQVDYNDSGSELWVEEKNTDGWYGVDNENGNTLSHAGSSWQRAYTYGDQVSENNNPNKPEGVTDGHFYNASSSEDEREKAQYFTSAYEDIWVKKFLQAYEGGANHGDYFVLGSDITIDSRLIPKDFVFTGHLDGQDHTIILSHPGERVYKQAENLEGLYVKNADNYDAWTIPTLYVKKVIEPEYYQEGDLVSIEGKTYDKNTVTLHTNEKYTQQEADEENAKHVVNNPEIEHGGSATLIYEDGYTPINAGDTKPPYYTVDENSKEAKVGDIKTEAQTTYEVAPAPTTLEQLKSNEYYLDDSGTRFTCPDLYQFSHTSPAYLFAGLNGIYSTPQESNSSLPVNQWEANVHKETNDFGEKTHWVPTVGYRAEVLNVKMGSSAVLLKAKATITGNVQNCWNGDTAINNNTPNIPQYK